MNIQAFPHRAALCRPDLSPRLPGVARRCKIVVCVVSSHGLIGLLQILAGLQSPFPVPVVIVPDRFTTLPDSLRFVLEEHSLMTAKTPKDGDIAAPGALYLVAGDAAVTITADHRFSVSTRSSNGTFEVTDQLLDSATRAYNGGVAALILTSAPVTQTEGVRFLRANGGIVLTADDLEIETSDAKADCDSCIVDYWLPRETIAPVLESLVLERTTSRMGSMPHTELVS